MLIYPARFYPCFYPYFCEYKVNSVKTRQHQLKAQCIDIPAQRGNHSSGQHFLKGYLVASSLVSSTRSKPLENTVFQGVFSCPETRYFLRFPFVFPLISKQVPKPIEKGLENTDFFARLSGFAFSLGFPLTTRLSPFRPVITVSVRSARSGRNALNEAFHPVRAVPFHLLCYMPVHVQCEGCRRVPEIALHSLDVVPGFDRRHGVRVAQIMKPDVR